MNPPDTLSRDERGLGAITARSRSVAETGELAVALASWLEAGDVVLLHGDLGAGKTTFVKALAVGLGIAVTVTSPSFALVNEYETGHGVPFTTVYHIDLYRLHERDELDSIGFAELVAPEQGITVVEWPERASEDLPRRYLLVEVEVVPAEQRVFRLSASPPDQRWAARLAALRQSLPNQET